MSDPEALAANGGGYGEPGAETPPAVPASNENPGGAPPPPPAPKPARALGIPKGEDYFTLYAWIRERGFALNNDDHITLRRKFEPR